MNDYILPLQRLIEQFGRLNGVGKKTAVRLALSVLDLSDAQVEEFSDALLSARRDICECRVCHNLSTDGLCVVCADEERDHGLVCVVEDPKAVMAFEKVSGYRGVYYVLGGVLSPMKGISADKIHLDGLLNLIGSGKVREVIIATNPTVEGEATAMYISRLAEGSGVKISRLAYGVPVGGDLEYADAVTLSRALDGRREIN